MISYLWSLICGYFRPLIKWFLHQTTKMCELQRICYGRASGAPRALDIEKSLRQSKNLTIQALLKRLDEIASRRGITIDSERYFLEDAITTVLLGKEIHPDAHPAFATSFGKCVELIWGYHQLVVECEDMRKTAYDSDNPEHEMKLLKLWNLMKPAEPLESRVTKQWQDIGFQGDDPKTDFRGMGVLGLDNLLYFAQKYPSAASRALLHSVHPKYGYAYAIVGINITSMALRLMRDGTAKTHIYNTAKTLPSIRLFHHFYSYLFFEFDNFWIESKPRSMMEFSSIQHKFEKTIRLALANPTTVFRLNALIDKV